MTTDIARLTLLLRPGLDLPPQESLWAQRLHDHHYRLLMSSFYVPLAVGDIVTANRDSYEQLTIEEIKEPALDTFAMARCNSAIDHTRATALARRWRRHGALWNEHCGAGINTAWSGSIDPENVYAILKPDLDPADGWSEPRVYEPRERTSRRLDAWARLG